MFSLQRLFCGRVSLAVHKAYTSAVTHPSRLSRDSQKSKCRYSTPAKQVPPFPYQRVHIPVLLEEAIEYLLPRDGRTYLDATFGEGGYTKRILDSANCAVVAIDQDPAAVDKAQQLSRIYPNRLSVKWEQFSNISKLQQSFDGIVMDIGLSSSQLDSDRGFSFQRDDPLDMRMSCTAKHGALRRLVPANVVVNQFSRAKMASIFSSFGQERFAGKIAFEIEKRRANFPIETTQQLVDAVLAAVPKGYAQKSPIHPATRIFQALRIFVNDELSELQSALVSATQMLNPGGRLVVVSFHSLEDSIVKKFFRGISQQQQQQHSTNETSEPTIFNVITKRAVKVSEHEIEHNPRSRSAKLRALERKA